MNHYYRLVFNTFRQLWMAIPESGRGHSLGGAQPAPASAGTTHRATAFAVPLLTLTLASLSSAAGALDAATLPTGATVTTGAATLSTAGNTLTVHQTTEKTALNWQSFNIGSSATVNFVQPSTTSIALNRVTGSGASEIYGKLNANGQVFLLNPNGILFGRSAQVTTGGLVASTLSLSDSDFLAGNYRLAGTAGAVTNQGALSGNYVALLGGQVSNQGTITARLGTVALAAGEDITLDFAGDGLTSVTVNRGTLKALAENKQLIQADGGTVLLTAKAADRLIQAVVNNEGIIEARTVDTSSGTIKLLADMNNGVVKVGGTLDASAPNGGNGGFIETSGATVSIQSGATVTAGSGGTWLIDPTDITIDTTAATAIAGTLNAGSNVTQDTASAGTDAGDITVAAPISWTGTGTLTLRADNDIAINAAITGTNGGLTLNAVNAISASAAVNVGTFTLLSGNWSQVAATLPTFAATDFRITGGSFLRALGGNGSSATPYQIADVYGLQGIGSSATLRSQSYQLAKDIDAAGTASWNSGAGFVPIGTWSSKFSGTFNGLGHTLTGLTIDRPVTNYVGLFGATDNATIANVGLVGGSITGYTYVGGLVGTNYTGSSITRSYATGNVTGNSSVGGLVGYNSASITSSYATGNVSGSGFEVGGLVGGNISSGITSSYATGKVSGNSFVGGLVGANYGSITSSYATGNVTGTYPVGGLVGYNDGSITNSFWNTTTSGQSAGCGYGTCTGATGLTDAQMKQAASFSAWGSAISAAGGSNATWRIYEGNTYPLLRLFLTPLTITLGDATRPYDGTTTAPTSALAYSTSPDMSLLLGSSSLSLTSANVGTYSLSAANLYSPQQGYDISVSSTGSVTITPASITVTAPAVTKTYDGTTTASGTPIVSSGTLFGSDSLGGALAFTDANAGSGKTVTASSMTLSDGNGGGNYTVMYADSYNGTITPATLTVTAPDVSKTYDGTTTAVGSAIVSGLFGSDSFSGGALAFTNANAGSGKTVTASGVTLSDGNNGGNYTVTYADSHNGTITPATLTVTAPDVTKTYDGTTVATGSPIVSGTLFGADSLSGGALAFTDANAGSGKTVTASGVTLSDGNNGGNYAVSYVASTNSTITPAPLTVAANSVSVPFGWVPFAGGAGVTFDGLVGGENGSVLSGSLVYAGSSQGAFRAGTYAITASGLTNPNYVLTYVDGSLTILPAPMAFFTASPAYLAAVVSADQTGSPLPWGTPGHAPFVASAEPESPPAHPGSLALSIVDGGMRLPAGLTP